MRVFLQRVILLCLMLLLWVFIDMFNITLLLHTQVVDSYLSIVRPYFDIDFSFVFLFIT